MLNAKEIYADFARIFSRMETVCSQKKQAKGLTSRYPLSRDIL